MSEKMIPIRGKHVSEDTIVEALQKHCGFEEKPYVFKVSDLAENRDGGKRIICPDSNGGVMSIDLSGFHMSSSQSSFDALGYKKIGVLSDFIK